MAVTIKLKNASGSDPSASDLVLGELAVRTDNGKIFLKKDNGSVAEVSGGGGVDDGDKGDITVSNSGDTWTIDNDAITQAKIADDAVGTDQIATSSIVTNRLNDDAVTYAKIQNVSATDRVLGRDSSGAGVIEEISPSSLRTMINVEDGATADQTAAEIKTLLNSNGIVNAQVDASAAIAGTKISPDFGSQNITTTGTGTFNGGDVIIESSAQPSVHLRDSGDNPDYILRNNDGAFIIYDSTNTTTRLQVNTDGHVDVTGNLDVGAGVDVTGNISVSGTVDGVDIAARNTLFGGLTSSSGVLTNGVTATTQSASDNSTKVATTAYTDTAISNLVDSSPSALNTLNELAAALGDDANFSTTVTNSIATKLPLAGGTMSGAIDLDSNNITNGGTISGTFSGSGASLTSLNASNISSGTIAAARVATLNQNTTGSAATLTTARTIAGVSFDGSADISLNNNAITNGAGYITATLTTEQVQDIVGGMFTGNTETNITATYQDSDGTIDLVSTDTNTTYSVGDGGLTQNNFTNTLKSKLDGIAASATNVTNNNQLTNGAGYITSADGGNAQTLDSLDSSAFLRSNADDTCSYRIVFANCETDNHDDIDTATAYHGAFEVYNVNSGNDAFFAFHTANDFACYFGLDAGINDLAVGGWSFGANSYRIWHAGNDGSGSGLDADLLDGVQHSSFLRSDEADTASGDISFGGGAGAVTISGNSDIRLSSGSWTGEACKIQHHSNWLYIQGGSSGHVIRRSNGNDAWYWDSGGTFYPASDSVYDIGKSGTRPNTVYADHFNGSGANLTNLPSQTDNNFTTTLKNKLDGIAASATNVTNNNQLTNGAGYVTSAGATSFSGLSDYATGNWTPAPHWGSGSNAYGYYVRTGNVVHCWGYIDSLSTGSSGAMRINGLPYNASGQQNTGSVLTQRNGDGDQNLSILLLNNTSYFHVYKCDSGTWSALTYHDMNSSSNIWYWQLTYRI